MPEFVWSAPDLLQSCQALSTFADDSAVEFRGNLELNGDKFGLIRFFGVDSSGDGRGSSAGRAVLRVLVPAMQREQSR